MLAHERRQAMRALNQHTLFFIPIQFLAPVMALVALSLVVIGLTDAPEG